MSALQVLDEARILNADGSVLYDLDMSELVALKWSGIVVAPREFAGYVDDDGPVGASTRELIADLLVDAVRRDLEAAPA